MSGVGGVSVGGVRVGGLQVCDVASDSFHTDWIHIDSGQDRTGADQAASGRTAARQSAASRSARQSDRLAGAPRLGTRPMDASSRFRPPWLAPGDGPRRQSERASRSSARTMTAVWSAERRVGSRAGSVGARPMPRHARPPPRCGIPTGRDIQGPGPAAWRLVSRGAAHATAAGPRAQRWRGRWVRTGPAAAPLRNQVPGHRPPDLTRAGSWRIGHRRLATLRT
jgi:hypothetical protein